MHACGGITPMKTIVADAWRTIVPGVDEKDGPLSTLLVGLTVVTGLVDAFSYLSLGHVFVANMTGNVVFLAFALAGARGFSAVASLCALGAFSVGAVAGGRLSATLSRQRGRVLVVVSAFEVLFVAVSAVVVGVAHSPGSGGTRYILIIVLSLSMGAQNAMARRLAVPDLTTTVLTLTITGISADSRLGGGRGSKAGRRLVSALAMFLGAVIGALLVLKVGRIWTVLVALTLLSAVSATGAVLARTNPPWTRPSP
jgi:uncharacterized membrane protein YoaK (UPF0700 family)